MNARVAEHVFRPRLFGPRLRFRVDLHGVSVFGPRDDHTLIRWEWISEISESGAAVVVRSTSAEVTFPSGAFGLKPAELAELIRRAASITERPEVIGALKART